MAPLTQAQLVEEAQSDASQSPNTRYWHVLITLPVSELLDAVLRDHKAGRIVSTQAQFDEIVSPSAAGKGICFCVCSLHTRRTMYFRVL